MEFPIVDLISADSHVVEPPEMWSSYVERAFHDRVPILERGADRDHLWCDGTRLAPIELYVHASFRQTNESTPTRWENTIPAAAYDVSARVEALNRDGVWGEVLFPTVAMSLMAGDPGLTGAMFRGYNTWLSEIAGSSEGRLKAVALLDPRDCDLALLEAERASDLGHVGMVLPLHPPTETPYSDRSYDSLWAGLASLGLPVHLHAATGKRSGQSWNSGAAADLVLRQMVAIETTLLDLVLTGLFDRLPTLKVVSVENDAGWVPYLLSRSDGWWSRNRQWVEADRRCGELPSWYFRNNVSYTFMDDRAAVLTSELIGLESLMWSSDFPHPSTTWPTSRHGLESCLGGLPEHARSALSRGNAAALYGFELDCSQ